MVNKLEPVILLSLFPLRFTRQPNNFTLYRRMAAHDYRKHFKRVMIFRCQGHGVAHWDCDDFTLREVRRLSRGFCGLAILAIEFAWARRWLRSARAVMPKRTEGHILRKRSL